MLLISSMTREIVIGASYTYLKGLWAKRLLQSLAIVPVNDSWPSELFIAV